MNKVILMGRLTRDPNVRYSPRNNSQEEMAIARYTLAVDRRGAKDGQQSADFISCVAFGRDGEFAEKYLKQGTKVVVTGRIQTGSYTNRDGQKVYTTDVTRNSLTARVRAAITAALVAATATAAETAAAISRGQDLLRPVRSAMDL